MTVTGKLLVIAGQDWGFPAWRYNQDRRHRLCGTHAQTFESQISTPLPLQLPGEPVLVVFAAGKHTEGVFAGKHCPLIRRPPDEFFLRTQR